MKYWRYFTLAAVCLIVGIGIGSAANSTSDQATGSTQTSAAPEATATVGDTPTPAPTPTLEERRREKARAAAERRRAKARAAAKRRREAKARAAEKAEAARKRAARIAALTKSFSGNGGLTLAPMKIRTESTLTWTNDGQLFQIWDNDSGGNVLVNSQGAGGKTFMGPGRYVLQVNAVGTWTIRITPR
jgi:hypothetical protein